MIYVLLNSHSSSDSIKLSAQINHFFAVQRPRDFDTLGKQEGNKNKIKLLANS